MTHRSILFITDNREFRRQVRESRYLKNHCSHRFYDDHANAIARIKDPTTPAVHFVVLATEHVPEHFMDDFVAVRPRPKLVIIGPHEEHIGNPDVIFVTSLSELERVLKEQHAPEGRDRA